MTRGILDTLIRMDSVLPEPTVADPVRFQVVSVSSMEAVKNLRSGTWVLVSRSALREIVREMCDLEARAQE